MNNKLEMFRQYIQNNQIMVSFLVVLQLLFTIAIAITIISLNTNTHEIPNLQISNLSEQLKELPSGSVKKIENKLYGIVTSNQGMLQSIKNSDAKIREGTLVNLYFEEIDMHYINFIVDIPSIQQSYQIFTEWSDNDNNKYYLVDRTTLAMCLTQDQMIYDDFGCKDGSIYQNQVQSFIVSEFINKFNFNYFNPSVDTLDHSLIKINPISFEIDNITKASYIEETKNAVSSLGIPPDIFVYRIVEPEDLNYYNSIIDY